MRGQWHQQYYLKHFDKTLVIYLSIKLGIMLVSADMQISDFSILQAMRIKLKTKPKPMQSICGYWIMNGSVEGWKAVFL